MYNLFNLMGLYNNSNFRDNYYCNDNNYNNDNIKFSNFVKKIVKELLNHTVCLTSNSIPSK